jgi:hypothetical protein
MAADTDDLTTPRRALSLVVLLSLVCPRGW